MIILLDTGILIFLSSDPNFSEEASQCQEWFYKLLSKSVRVVSPEVCDYEVRRGLLLLDKKSSITNGAGIQALNKLEENGIEFLPLSRKVLLKAANIWAIARLNGQGSPKGVDVDMLVLAHWMIEKEDFPGQRIVIVTQNLKDFRIFEGTDLEVEACNWTDINI